MAKRFQFSKGDRVDFNLSGAGNGTPGTIANRVHTQPVPLYVVKWDDGNADNESYYEYELIPYVEKVENNEEEAPGPMLSAEKRSSST